MRQYFSLLQLTMEIITDSFNRQHYYRNETPSPYDKSTIAFRGQRQMFFFFFFLSFLIHLLTHLFIALFSSHFLCWKWKKHYIYSLKFFFFFPQKLYLTIQVALERTKMRNFPV